MAFLLRRALAGTPAARRGFSTAGMQAPLLTTPAVVNQLLSEPKKDEKTVLLDASWFMPNSPRDGKAEFQEKRLPGAQFLDLDEVATPHELGLKHMMPSPEAFAKACGQFGILPGTNVILYDTHGVFSSPRALFMFRSFGHDKSTLLDGGLPRWVDEGFSLEKGAPKKPEPTRYVTRPLKFENIRDYEHMVTNSSLLPSQAEIVLDARSAERFSGAAPEPRPGLSSGHIPSSVSLPFNMFLQKHKSKADGSEYTTFLDRDSLKRVLDDTLGPETVRAMFEGKSIVTTCGSGMTAAVLWVGLRMLNHDKVALYDESWTGYAMRPQSRIIKD